MTLSWKELVFHCLSVKVGEPSLVKEILKMAMKGRFSFLEEEAREFHSRNIEPVLKYVRFHRVWLGLAPPDMGANLLGQNVSVHSRTCHSEAIDELKSSWKERIPEERRQAVTRHKESTLLLWRGQGEEDIENLRQQYPSIENSIKWYGEIHEGRYYLFWDKKLALPIADCAARRRQSKASLMSDFDINIIDGEGLYSRISDTWVYEYEQWIKNRGSWGKRQSEFTMVHRIGKKEKKHIDDMFLKE